MHNFNINCWSLTVSCLSTRAATATATGEVATALAADSSSSSSSSGQQQQAAADTVLIDITQCMNFRKFTHKIYHYPQQLLFTYRVTNWCLRASQPQQQPATIVVTAAARQCSVSKYILSNSLFNTRKQYTVSNIFTYRFKSDDLRRLKRRRRTQCNTMQRECKTLSKLLYIL